MVTLEGAQEIVVKDMELWIVNVAVVDYGSQPGSGTLLVSFKETEAPRKICALTDETPNCVLNLFIGKSDEVRIQNAGNLSLGILGYHLRAPRAGVPKHPSRVVNAVDSSPMRPAFSRAPRHYSSEEPEEPQTSGAGKEQGSEGDDSNDDKIYDNRVCEPMSGDNGEEDELDEDEDEDEDEDSSEDERLVLAPTPTKAGATGHRSWPLEPRPKPRPVARPSEIKSAAKEGTSKGAVNNHASLSPYQDPQPSTRKRNNQHLQTYEEGAIERANVISTPTPRKKVRKGKK
ncbi:hypothetical protein CYLTODRAFT_427641 [Cylindrobasidium torrendii FP15055 ss-10]|uniref:Nucleoplasmin-like domain-containing protein n=1 Tax=Cylindrobasidium torrendii FP15055 ss-10 TaxID=1314674 RepID=A0A0D7AS85_9AGAR|nr:hypothetical protein CYLTODRAFT_427641 [Cylindrobasidium torrendii FP15055 ss-10]